MKYIEKIIAYLSENLVFAAIMGACVLLILIMIIALCAKKAKAKRRAKDRSEPNVTTETTETPKPSPAETEQKVPEKTETIPEEEVKPVSVSQNEIKDGNEPEPSTEVKSEASPEEDKVNLKEFKDAPVENESNFFENEDEKDKLARYNGKWVICRVMTAINGEHSESVPKEETYFFELRASNGEKLLTSEEYTTYSGALNGIATHKKNIEKGNFKIVPSKKGDYIFKLLNGKNMLLCMGENYATKARCESAVESTKRFAASAILDENVQDILISPPAEEEEPTPREVLDNGYLGKWVVRKNVSSDGEEVFYFELYASNGEKLLSSEEYTTYIGAVNGIETHKTNIERGNFRVSLTKHGDYIYKLLNGNSQLLCLGEHYKTRRRCESAIESVKRFAKNAPVLADSETVTRNS